MGVTEGGEDEAEDLLLDGLGFTGGGVGFSFGGGGQVKEGDLGEVGDLAEVEKEEGGGGGTDSVISAWVSWMTASSTTGGR